MKRADTRLHGILSMPVAAATLVLAQSAGAAPPATQWQAGYESQAAYAADQPGDAMPLGPVPESMVNRGSARARADSTSESLAGYAADQPGNAMPTGGRSAVPLSSREPAGDRGRERIHRRSAAAFAADQAGDAMPVGTRDAFTLREQWTTVGGPRARGGRGS